MQIRYRIDNEDVALEVHGTQVQGRPEILAQLHDDPLHAQPWFPDGYSVAPLLSGAEVQSMRHAITGLLSSILRDHGKDASGLMLERYHDWVDDDLHQRVIAKTRRLPLQDFGISANDMIRRLSALVGRELGPRNPALGAEQWVICRINRPGSEDFNPVHKDAYEALDHAGMVPPMVNFWIPVCGVGGATGLPVAAGSHLISEDQIERTRAGCTINGKDYSVNTVIRWGGASELRTIAPDPGEVLVFSSHLIHGLGRNLAPDSTRIALEFRLFALD